MRVDGLVFAGENLVGRELSLIDAVGTARRLGFDATITAPAKPRNYDLRNANDRLAAEGNGMEGVYRLVRVDPNQGVDAVSEVARGIGDLGCVGVYIDPDEEVFRAQSAVEVVREARRLGVPVVISGGIPGRSEPLQVLALAERFPEARIVITSGAQINISGLSMIDAWFALVANPNLLVLSNGEYRQDYLERIVRELGPERLLYASSAPRYDQTFEAARIANVRLTESERRAVEGDNAVHIFDLG